MEQDIEGSRGPCCLSRSLTGLGQRAAGMAPSASYSKPPKWWLRSKARILPAVFQPVASSVQEHAQQRNRAKAWEGQQNKGDGRRSEAGMVEHSTGGGTAALASAAGLLPASVSGQAGRKQRCCRKVVGPGGQTAVHLGLAGLLPGSAPRYRAGTARGWRKHGVGWRCDGGEGGRWSGWSRERRVAGSRTGGRAERRPGLCSQHADPTQARPQRPEEAPKRPIC